MKALLAGLLLSISSPETRRDCFHVTDDGVGVDCCDSPVSDGRVVRMCVRAANKTPWQPLPGSTCEQSDGGWSPCAPRRTDTASVPPPATPTPTIPTAPGVRVKL
jgi:hypothetical protein